MKLIFESQIIQSVTWGKSNTKYQC